MRIGKFGKHFLSRRQGWPMIQILLMTFVNDHRMHNRVPTFRQSIWNWVTKTSVRGHTKKTSQGPRLKSKQEVVHFGRIQEVILFLKITCRGKKGFMLGRVGFWDQLIRTRFSQFEWLGRSTSVLIVLDFGTSAKQTCIHPIIISAQMLCKSKWNRFVKIWSTVNKHKS